MVIQEWLLQKNKSRWGMLGAEGQDFVPFIETCDSIHAETNVAYAMFPNFITPTDTSGYVAILFWKSLRETEIEYLQLGPKWEGKENHNIGLIRKPLFIQ